MEKYLLTARNLAHNKRQGSGKLSLWDRLERIADFENIHIDAPFPEQTLHLNWEECFTPLYAKEPFRELISPRLFSYKFQYLASFEYAEHPIKCGGGEGVNCETFTAKMNDRPRKQAMQLYLVDRFFAPCRKNSIRPTSKRILNLARERSWL